MQRIPRILPATQRSARRRLAPSIAPTTAKGRKSVSSGRRNRPWTPRAYAATPHSVPRMAPVSAFSAKPGEFFALSTARIYAGSRAPALKSQWFPRSNRYHVFGGSSVPITRKETSQSADDPAHDENQHYQQRHRERQRQERVVPDRDPHGSNRPELGDVRYRIGERLG